jgi:NAD-dependent SIR2 family protein deacetylase
MSSAIFLGAGASKSEGIPVQDEILKIYFQKNKPDKYFKKNNDFNMDSTLVNFFKGVFNIDVTSQKIMPEDFPTFEEVIGILDLAEFRKETLMLDSVLGNFLGQSIQKGVDISNIPSIIFNSMENHLIRLYLVILIANVLVYSTENTKGLYKQLIDNLSMDGVLQDTLFITTNYDVLADNAIINCLSDKSVDYGVDCTNFQSQSQTTFPSHNPVKLLKLHGSLNWLYCSSCNNLKLTGVSQDKILLVTDFTRAICDKCGSLTLPVIIPPTYFKNMSNVFLSTIWNKTENLLREVDHIIFCGYSFSDADMHIKYLLKKIQLGRGNDLRFTVINNYEGKTVESVEEEKRRYKRFLGNSVFYTEDSFIEFVENPGFYLNRLNSKL